MNFWNQLSSGFTCLAPMEGVTDLVFRQVIAKAARPDVFFTEFTNVSSYASPEGRPNALHRLQFLPSEQPIVAQIWGNNPDHFAITAKGLQDLGYTAIDINMGCPDRHVVAHGAGAALIKNPDLAAQIITAAKTPGLNLSVKTRLGYTHTDEWQPWLSFLLQQDLSALTIHLRTKKEMSKAPAHHELAPDIIGLRNQLAPHTKLIINGDILDPANGQPFIQQGADGIMIGRGVFANPFCFESQPQEHSPAELITLLRYHLDLFDQQLPPGKFDPLKRFFKIYIHGFRGAVETREQLMNCRTTSEVRAIINQMETNL